MPVVHGDVALTYHPAYVPNSLIHAINQSSCLGVATFCHSPLQNERHIQSHWQPHHDQDSTSLLVE